MEIDTIANLVAADSEAVQPQFSLYEEDAIISLAIDYPDFFYPVMQFVQPGMFKKIECEWVMGLIKNSFEEHGVVPTRDFLLREVELDGNFDQVTNLINRKSNLREIPLIKKTLLKWTQERAFGLVYSTAGYEAYRTGDFAKIQQLIEEAGRITDIGDRGFSFFDDYEKLFEPQSTINLTTGFKRLDKVLNNGGPSPKEVCCWLAPTNTGKSILLVNNAITSLQGKNRDGTDGQNVLLITFELDTIKTALRCLGVSTGVPMSQIADHKDYIKRTIKGIQQTYNRHFMIYELPPEEHSVATIYGLIDRIKRLEGWKPDVVILDYMDLMVSKNPAYNKDDYNRQKHVAAEIRGLAINEDVLVFTATQTNRAAELSSHTNRSGKKSESTDREMIDMSKAAESYGKQFALDYVVSLNQSDKDRKATPARLMFFVAKNRNGPKFMTIMCEINYDTMIVKESL